MIPNLKKVIRGLEHHLLDDDGYPNCNGCPYAPCSVRCHGDLVADALALLKAQKPMKPIFSEEKYGDALHHCPSCERALPNSGVYGKSYYCYKCGKALKWNG